MARGGAPRTSVLARHTQAGKHAGRACARGAVARRCAHWALPHCLALLHIRPRQAEALRHTVAAPRVAPLLRAADQRVVRALARVAQDTCAATRTREPAAPARAARSTERMCTKATHHERQRAVLPSLVAPAHRLSWCRDLCRASSVAGWSGIAACQPASRAMPAWKAAQRLTYSRFEGNSECARRILSMLSLRSSVTCCQGT